MTGNKIADKITSIDKSKKRKKQKSRRNLHSTRKDNKLMMTLNCFEHKMQNHCIRKEFQTITNFLDTNFDDKDLPRFFTNIWIEVYQQS